MACGSELLLLFLLLLQPAKIPPANKIPTNAMRFRFFILNSSPLSKVFNNTILHYLIVFSNNFYLQIENVFSSITTSISMSKRL